MCAHWWTEPGLPDQRGELLLLPESWLDTRCKLLPSVRLGLLMKVSFQTCILVTRYSGLDANKISEAGVGFAIKSNLVSKRLAPLKGINDRLMTVRCNVEFLPPPPPLNTNHGCLFYIFPGQFSTVEKISTCWILNLGCVSTAHSYALRSGPIEYIYWTIFSSSISYLKRLKKGVML